MAKPTYTISDLAAEFEITTRTIRFYEEKGLLSPSRSGTSRIYTPADRTKLRLILRGKRLGLSLEESRDIIEMYDPAGGNVEQLQKLIDRIRLQRSQLEQQIRDAQAMIRELGDAEKNCMKAMPGAPAGKKLRRRAN